MTSGIAGIYGTIDPLKIYQVQIRVSDSFTTLYRYFDIPTGVWPVFFKAGGNGVAFGKVSEMEDTVEVHPNWKLFAGGLDVVNLLKSRVESVNGKTGAVTLDANSIGAAKSDHSHTPESVGAVASSELSSLIKSFVGVSKIQVGTISASIPQTTNSTPTTAISVEFPTPMSAAPDAIAVSCVTTSPQIRSVSPSSASGTGFSCNFYNNYSAGTLYAYWIAVWK